MIALGETSFRMWLRVRHRASAPTGEPTHTREQAVLGSVDEWQLARAEARQLGLPLHPDAPKTWDTLLALGAVLRRVPRTGRVLDAGAERYSALLPSLWLYGYQDLHGLNLAFTRETRRGPIRYVPGDATRTTWDDATFDAITCLSVIEHGVDVDAFLAESARLLRPGGVLVVSTDYWPQPIDTRGQHAYGVPIHVFTRDEMIAFVALAARRGLVPTTPVDAALAFDPGERAVAWRRFGLHYTFVSLTFVKR